MLESLPNIDEIIGIRYNMSDELVECHAPKPILFPTGEVYISYVVHSALVDDKF